MNNMTFLFLIIIVVMGIFLAWTYTKSGKKWLKTYSEHLDIELYPIHGSYGIIYFFYKIRVLFLVTLGF